MRSFFRNRPLQEPITDVHDLLRQIERKDASFRIAQSTFFALILAGLAVLLLLTYNVQNENNQLLKSQSNSLNQQKKTVAQLENNDQDTHKAISDLQQHIDCVVELFQQPDHSSLSISDLQNCSFTASAPESSTGSTKSTVKPAQPTPVTKTSTPVSPPASKTKSPNPKSHPFLCIITLGLLGCK